MASFLRRAYGKDSGAVSPKIGPQIFGVVTFFILLIKIRKLRHRPFTRSYLHSGRLRPDFAHLPKKPHFI